MTLTTGTDPSALVATVPTSVYEAVGGRPALVAAVDNFYGRLVEDPVLGPFFHGRVGERHRRYVVTILAEALGGPERYRGPDMAVRTRAWASATPISTAPPPTWWPRWTISGCLVTWLSA